MHKDSLYKRDSKGKVREWSVRTEGDSVVVTHGVSGGKLVDKITKCKAKNVGRSNETTPEEQALLEAKSKWNHQVQREDYHTDVNKAGLQLRPMLALDYLKVPHRVDWSGVVGQPKLDGLRLVTGNRFIDGRDCPFEMMTRKGETYQVPHLISPCEGLLKLVNNLCDGRCIALDGEVYLHGTPLQTISSWAKKYKKGLTEQLEFHVFDLVIPDMPFHERYSILEQAMKSVGEDSLKIVNVFGTSESLIKGHLGFYMEKGYEGVILRHTEGKYAIANRSPDLFKFKDFYDDEFKVTDVWEDRNGNAMLTCEAYTGQKLSAEDYTVEHKFTFNCTPKRSHDFRKAMLKSKEDWIGKWIKVKYQGLTVDKIPQFSSGLELRDCTEDGKPLN